MTETNEQYHADTQRVSNSMLSVLQRSPQEYQQRYVTKTMPHPKPSEAMALGTLVHCMALEPHEVANRFIFKPYGMDRRTREGKLAWQTLVESGKDIVTLEQFETAQACWQALAYHDQIGVALRADGIIEQRIDWHRGGLAMRCKPDKVIPTMRLIIDVKTSADASPKEFARSVANYGYARQAALYKDAVEATYCDNQQEEFRFLFAVVCTEPPYEVACYELSDEAMRYGYRNADTLISELQVRIERDDWLPDWGSGIVTLDLPRWI